MNEKTYWYDPTTNDVYYESVMCGTERITLDERSEE